MLRCFLINNNNNKEMFAFFPLLFLNLKLPHWLFVSCSVASCVTIE